MGCSDTSAAGARTWTPHRAVRTPRPHRDTDPTCARALPLRHKRIYATVTVCVIVAACTSGAPTVQHMSSHNGVALISSRPDHLQFTGRLVVRVGTEYRSPRGP
jgi:hypothetical protein